MSDISFPAWVKVTKCRTQTSLVIEHTRHGAIRHEITMGRTRRDNIERFAVKMGYPSSWLGEEIF